MTPSHLAPLGRDYPEPIVDHDAARRAALERYAVVRAPAVHAAPS